jgi:LysM repeat protein
VFYVIQEGDTLLGVAARYGISLDAIRLANPDLKPELLQIGQQLTIPPLTGDNQPLGPMPVSTPIPLTIGNTAWYTTPTGGLWFVGEVVNETDFSVENVRLGVTVYDRDGSVAAQSDGWAAADVLATGEKAPFGMLFGPEVAEMATYDAYLLSSEPVTRDGFWNTDLTITESAGGLEDQVYRLSGTVRNDGDVEANEVTLVVTLYDSNGRITGFLQERLDESLPAGSETAFVLWLAPVGPGSEQHLVAVSGRLQQETG